MNPLTRSSDNWNSNPGRANTLNQNMLFRSDNTYGVPLMERTDCIPPTLVPWGRPRALRAAPTASAVHFFLDDYAFERVWYRAETHARTIVRHGCALTPDFSTYPNWPTAMNLWQVYRNRWLGRYWQAAGALVVPTVGWSNAASLDYSFLGVKKGSVVALQTQTVQKRDAAEHELFRLGFAELLRVIEPFMILCYGSLARIPLLPPAPVQEYPTFWETRRPSLVCGS